MLKLFPRLRDRIALLGIGAGRYIVRDIANLTRAISSFVLGQRRHIPVNTLRESEEIGQLSQAYENMAASAQKNQRELEQQKFALDQHAIVSIADLGGNIIYANQKFCDISQYSREELIGKNHRILNSSLHSALFFEELWKSISSGKIWRGEIRNRKKDGSHYWVETTIVPLTDESGTPYQYISIRTEITELIRIQEELTEARNNLETTVQERTAELLKTNKLLTQDIAARRQAEQALQLAIASEQNLTQQQIAILDALPASIALLDRLGNIVTTNGAWIQFSRGNAMIPPATWAGMNYLAVCEGATGNGHADAQAAAVGIRAVLSGGQSLFSMAYECHSPENRRWYRLLAAPMTMDGNGTPRQNGAVVMHIDISERMLAALELERSNQSLRTLQQQLVQSEKMAAIGQLSAGLAHEINTPVAYVHSNLQMLQEDMHDIFGRIAGTMEAQGRDSPDRQFSTTELDAIKNSIDTLIARCLDGTARVAKITRDLLDSAHPGEGGRESGNLHETLQTAITLAAHEINDRASIHALYGDLPAVHYHELQISQVFLNLLLNAAQAIEKDGSITIRTGTQAGNAWVQISDTGKGIAPEHLSRIFDPFFTTKSAGTGLGLALCYRIVLQHGGRIDVTSEPGVGSAFTVSLPIRQQPPLT